jgi:hypothetical protein
VVADQAGLAVLAHQLDALVGAGAVADDVAQAPELVHPGVLDVVEDGLQGRQVRVDVAEDGCSHGYGRQRAKARPRTALS